MQELGETVDAILEDDLRMLEGIIAEHSGRADPYWVVIAAKPSKVRDKKGRGCIMRHFEAHFTKPRPMVGSIIAEIDNVEGKIKWEINPPDVPFNYSALGVETIGTITAETSIPEAYKYN